MPLYVPDRFGPWQTLGITLTDAAVATVDPGNPIKFRKSPAGRVQLRGGVLVHTPPGGPAPTNLGTMQDTSLWASHNTYLRWAHTDAGGKGIGCLVANTGLLQPYLMGGQATYQFDLEYLLQTVVTYLPERG